MNYATHGEIFTSLISGDHRRIFAIRESEENLKPILMPEAQLKSSAKDTVRRTSHAKGSRNIDIQEWSKAKQSKPKENFLHIPMIKSSKYSDFYRNPAKVISDVFSIYTFYHRKSPNIPIQNLKYLFLNFLSLRNY